MNNLYNQLAVMYLIMIIGFAMAKTKFIKDNDLSALSNYTIYLAMTCSILNGMNISYTSEMAKDILLIALIEYLITLLIFLAIKLCYKKIKKRTVGHEKIYLFSLLYCNAALVGIPIVSSMLDEETLFYASVYIIFLNISLYSLGVAIISGNDTNAGKIDIKKLVNVWLLIILVGLILFLCRITYPKVIASTIKTLGATCMPMAMLINGAMLAGHKLRDVIKDKRAYIVSLLRLLIIPIMAFVIMRYLLRIQNKQMMMVIIIMLATPCPSGLGPFVKLYGGDYKLAVDIISISALLSCLTIPVLLTVINYLM